MVSMYPVVSNSGFTLSKKPIGIFLYSLRFHKNKPQDTRPMIFVTHSLIYFRAIARKLGEIICWPEKTDKTEKYQEHINSFAVQDTNEKKLRASLDMWSAKN